MTSEMLTTPEHHRRDLERLKQHFNEHSSDPTLSVTAASEAMFMSVRYVQKVFAQTGMTPLAWLLDCRMAEARRLLAETSIPVGEIARRVGYRDTAQFSRSFKHRTGLNPSRYRARSAPVAPY